MEQFKRRKKNMYYSTTSIRSSMRSINCEHRRNIEHRIHRLVSKSGKAEVERIGLQQHFYRYASDLANTLINSHWKWTFFYLLLTYTATWLIFAILWMIIAKANGDLETTDENIQCLTGVEGFAGYLLFSIETQTTIGFGGKNITPHCPEAIFLLVLQIFMEIFICGSLVCIIYVKMSEPNKVHPLKSFSKFGVIIQRDGQLCLMFRVQDYARKHECQNKINAYLIKKVREEIMFLHLKLEPLGALIWPVEVVHKITPSSPFWTYSAQDFIEKKFEIILTMEGSSLSTNHMSRICTSYLAKEIKWGFKFKPCVTYDKIKHRYVVHKTLFNVVEEFATPLCSAEKMNEIYQSLVHEASRNSSRSKMGDSTSPDSGFGQSNSSSDTRFIGPMNRALKESISSLSSTDEEAETNNISKHYYAKDIFSVKSVFSKLQKYVHPNKVVERNPVLETSF